MALRAGPPEVGRILVPRWRVTDSPPSSQGGTGTAGGADPGAALVGRGWAVDGARGRALGIAMTVRFTAIGCGISEGAAPPGSSGHLSHRPDHRRGDS